MKDRDRIRVTIKLADVAPLQFEIKRDDEQWIRTAERKVNSLWSHWREAHPQKSSKDVLAMVAYQYAELYYRLLGQVNSQAETLDEFEKMLDNILLQMPDDNSGDDATPNGRSAR